MDTYTQTSTTSSRAHVDEIAYSANRIVEESRSLATDVAALWSPPVPSRRWAFEGSQRLRPHILMVGAPNEGAPVSDLPR